MLILYVTILTVILLLLYTSIYSELYIDRYMSRLALIAYTMFALAVII